MIPRQPIGLCRTMEHLFLPSVFTLWQGCCVWPAYGLQWLRAGWLLPLHCLCWKTKTPALLHSVDQTKERSWQSFSLWYRLLSQCLSVREYSTLSTALRQRSDSSDAFCNTTLSQHLVFFSCRSPILMHFSSSSPHCVQCGSVLLNGFWLFIRLWNKACCKVVWFLP